MYHKYKQRGGNNIRTVPYWIREIVETDKTDTINVQSPSLHITGIAIKIGELV